MYICNFVQLKLRRLFSFTFNQIKKKGPTNSLKTLKFPEPCGGTNQDEISIHPTLIMRIYNLIQQV